MPKILRPERIHRKYIETYFPLQTDQFWREISNLRKIHSRTPPEITKHIPDLAIPKPKLGGKNPNKENASDANKSKASFSIERIKGALQMNHSIYLLPDQITRLKIFYEIGNILQGVYNHTGLIFTDINEDNFLLRFSSSNHEPEIYIVDWESARYQGEPISFWLYRPYAHPEILKAIALNRTLEARPAIDIHGLTMLMAEMLLNIDETFVTIPEREEISATLTGLKRLKKVLIELGGRIFLTKSYKLLGKPSLSLEEVNQLRLEIELLRFILKYIRLPYDSPKYNWDDWLADLDKIIKLAKN